MAHPKPALLIRRCLSRRRHLCCRRRRRVRVLTARNLHLYLVRLLQGTIRCFIRRLEPAQEVTQRAQELRARQQPPGPIETCTGVVQRWTNLWKV